MKIVLALYLCYLTSGIRWQHTEVSESSLAQESWGTRAKVFVVNVDKRVDRCGCASFQLARSPFQSQRWAAATPKNWHDICPDMFQNTSRYSHKEAPALLCSNYAIWKNLEADPVSKFAIVLEDDFFIRKSNFWFRVNRFLDRATVQDWDVVYVDPKDGGLYPKAEEADQLHMLTAEEKGVRGSQMMIIRQSSAGKLIAAAQQAYAPMDKFGTEMVNLGLKVGKWTPGLITQYSIGRYGRTWVPRSTYCKKSIIRSDIRGFKDDASEQSDESKWAQESDSAMESEEEAILKINPNEPDVKLPFDCPMKSKSDSELPKTPLESE